MRQYTILILLILHALASTTIEAQNYQRKYVELPVDIYQGDTIPVIHMQEVYIFQPPKFKNRRAEQFYWRTVRDVKRTLPLAKEIHGIVTDTYEYLQTIANEKQRKQYLDQKEKELMQQYTPIMKKLTFRQGKMLIKLIDRECDQTGYELIKVFMGRFKAGFYQTFAALFGASLKKEYDPELEDAEVEKIIYYVENGYL